MKKNLVIIGGGPAGLAAAVSAYDNGERDILIIERDAVLGGVLNQCIHNGFGLTRFKESLTGPEYAYRFISGAIDRKIPVLLNATVTNITADKEITVISPNGIEQIKATAIIIATGARERSRGAISVPGERPAGIFSAGTAQRYVNLMGEMPGREVVILGSGDIGLIMARRMTLEGARVKAVCEIQPYSSGLKRNIEQCLNDFDIPLYLSTTITNIKGKDRVESVTIAQVDQNKNPIKETEREIKCDTVLFSVGLIPENEIAKKMGLELERGTKGVSVDQFRQTEISGVFACGNALQIHDLVDFVSEEAEIAGKSAVEYINGNSFSGKQAKVIAGNGLLYALPQRINVESENSVKIFFRVNAIYKNVRLKITADGKEIISKVKDILTPGEMETAIIAGNKLKSVDKELKVELIYE